MGLMSERPGRYQRSFPGMVGAMVVLLIVVGAFVGFRDLVRSEPESPVQAVDYSGPADYARGQASFPLLAPEQLPDGWIATSVRFDPGSRPAWHLGMLTPQDRYVGLEQAPRSVAAMVEQYVDEKASEGEPVAVAGQEWRAFSDDQGDEALARRAGGATTLVFGRVEQETLADLVATLR